MNLEQQIAKAADEYRHKTNEHDLTVTGTFIAGANTLMPLLMKAIEQRDFETGAGTMPSDKYNVELLKLLETP